MKLHSFRTVDHLPVIDNRLIHDHVGIDPGGELAEHLLALPLSYYLGIRPLPNCEMVGLPLLDDELPCIQGTVKLPPAAMRFGCTLSNTVVMRSPEEFRDTLCERYDLLLVRTDIPPLHDLLIVVYEEGLGIQLEVFDRDDDERPPLLTDDVAAHCPVSGRLLLGVVVALIKL